MNPPPAKSLPRHLRPDGYLLRRPPDAGGGHEKAPPVRAGLRWQADAALGRGDLLQINLPSDKEHHPKGQRCTHLDSEASAASTASPLSGRYCTVSPSDGAFACSRSIAALIVENRRQV